jgi:hypothetical protein
MIIDGRGVYHPSPRAMRQWNRSSASNRGRKRRGSRLQPSTETCKLDSRVRTEKKRRGEQQALEARPPPPTVSCFCPSHQIREATLTVAHALPVGFL